MQAEANQSSTQESTPTGGIIQGASSSSSSSSSREAIPPAENSQNDTHEDCQSESKDTSVGENDNDSAHVAGTGVEPESSAVVDGKDSNEDASERGSKTIPGLRTEEAQDKDAVTETGSDSKHQEIR